MPDPVAQPAAPSGGFAAQIASAVAADRAAPAAQPAPAQQPAAPTPVGQLSPLAPASLQQQQPAPQTPSEQQAAEIDQILAAEGHAQEQQAADPFAEQIDGVSARDIIDAVKRGTLPDALLQRLRVNAVVDGDELPVTIDEARRGYMRISNHTRAMQALSQEREAFDQERAGLRQMFENWKDPQKLEVGMRRLGLRDAVVKSVTSGWDKPDGLMTGLRKLGLQESFEQACEVYAKQWAHEQRLPPELRSQLVADRKAMWDAAAAAEQTRLQAEAQQWEIQRQAAMAQQQQRQQVPAQQQQQAMNDLHSMKVAAFAGAGVVATPGTDRIFVQQFHALDALARQQGQQLALNDLVQQATAATAEIVNDYMRRNGASTGNGVHPVAQAQTPPPAQPVHTAVTPVSPTPPGLQAATARLSATAAGAPLSGQPSIPRGGTAGDFAKRIAAFQGSRRR